MGLISGANGVFKWNGPLRHPRLAYNSSEGLNVRSKEHLRTGDVQPGEAEPHRSLWEKNNEQTGEIVICIKQFELSGL